MEKSEIPLHVVLAEAWIKKGDKFLLARRSSKDDQAAGNWAVPGGKVEIELGEEVVEKTIYREVMEEVGIKVRNPRFISSRTFLRSSGHNVVGLAFLLDYESGEAKPLEDHEEVRWVTLEEINDLLPDYYSNTVERLKAMISKKIKISGNPAGKNLIANIF